MNLNKILFKERDEVEEILNADREVIDYSYGENKDELSLLLADKVWYKVVLRLEDTRN